MSWWRHGPSSPYDEATRCCHGDGRSYVASHDARVMTSVFRRQTTTIRDVIVMSSLARYHARVRTSFTEQNNHMNFHKCSSNFISSSSTTLIIDCSLNYLNGHLCMRMLASRNFKRWSTYDVADNSLTIVRWTIN